MENEDYFFSVCYKLRLFDFSQRVHRILLYFHFNFSLRPF
jgi:hypothetical protein